MKTFDVVIIGGGLAGFIAAIDVAKANHSVLLVEKAACFGGRAMTVYKNGALFNLGAHALYKSGPAESILVELGVQLEGGRPGKSGYVFWNNKVVSLSHFLWNELSLLEKIEFGKFMFKLKNIDTSTIGMISLSDWAEKELHSSLLRQIFLALCRTATYIQDPDYLLIGPVLKQLQRSFQSGVLYLNAGWQSIVNHLREIAIQSGVEIMNNKHVVRIEHNQNVKGLLFSTGERIPVSHVISTVSPTELYRLIPDADNTYIFNWKNQSRPAMAACLDLCLKQIPMTGRNISLGIDQPVFFTNQSKFAHLSDNGFHVMHLVKYNGTGGSDSKQDQKFLEDTMSLLHPGWQKELVTKQYLPNMVVANDYSHMGRIEQSPGPSVPGIGGLYVAGDWANREEFLADAAIASARRASLQVIKDLKERKPLSLL